jgi:peptide/nickel transport system permease protein
MNFIIKRLLQLIPTFIGISLISFFVMHLAPGEPMGIEADFNPKMTPEVRQKLREQYGLDKPVHIQYLHWVKGLFTLDLGKSFSADKRPVWDKIKERLPVTLFLNIISLFFIILISVPIGIYSAVNKDGPFDKGVTVGVFFFYAAPTFWVALILMLIFGVYLKWLPISGLHSLMGYQSMTFFEKIIDWTRHLIIPVSVSVIGSLAGISRYMRSSMLDVLNQDYITTARAKGLPENKVVFKHALRNALLPLITILGLSIPGLIGGSVIFESIFAIPGIGQLMWTSVLARDYPVLMGNLVIVAILTLMGNLLADIGYALADPRIRTGYKR